METRDDFQKRLGELTDAGWAAAALAAAVEGGLVAALTKPDYADGLAEQAGMPSDLVRRLLEVLYAAGFIRQDDQARWAPQPGFEPYCSGPHLESLRAELRRYQYHSSYLIAGAKSAGHTLTWGHTDPEILRAHGHFSRTTFGPIIEFLFPVMDRLPDRLRKPGAMALDVGAGVGGTAITLAEAFPELKVVALEPSPASLAEARVAVAAATLVERVELRPSRIEELGEQDTYDFVWLPQVFLPEEIFPGALTAALRALKPGGWMLMASISLPGEELRPSVARLRNTLLGGGARLPDDLQKQVRAAGFDPVSRVPFPGQGTLRFTVGQKPE